MTIKISTDELLFSIRKTARQELEAAFPDPEQRYKIEPGTEKDDVVYSLLNKAKDSLWSILYRFLSTEYGEIGTTTTIENEKLTLPDYYTFDFAGTPRRLMDKESAIASKSFSFILNETLANYYLTVAQADLSQVHAQLSQVDEQALTKLIYTKRPPIL